MYDSPFTDVSPSGPEDLFSEADVDALFRLADEFRETLNPEPTNRSTARRDAGAALGRLLNLADGILGQGTNVMVLLTTNEEVARLHPALVRPGRCLASVSFPPFEPHQASEWMGKDVGGPMTLAEMLEATGVLTSRGVI